MRVPTSVFATCFALAMAAWPAAAQQQDKPPLAVDGEWISLTGTVKSVGEEEFTLNYGQGQITVEMDDYDWYDETAVLRGDKVTVTGRMDKGFHEERSIEASSVYVPKLHRYFYANPADEEDGYYSDPVNAYSYNRDAKDDEWIAVTGTVTAIDGVEMMISTGLKMYRVDTGSVPNTPVGKSVDIVTASRFPAKWTPRICLTSVRSRRPRSSSSKTTTFDRSTAPPRRLISREVPTAPAAAATQTGAFLCDAPDMILRPRSPRLRHAKNVGREPSGPFGLSGQTRQTAARSAQADGARDSVLLLVQR